MSNARHPETRAAAAGISEDRAHRAVAPPVYLTSTYEWQTLETKPEYSYSRGENPSRNMLARALADLEGAATGVMTSSGIAAVDLTLCLVNPGELVVAPSNCYGGVHRLLSARAKKGQLDVVFVDQTDEAALKAAIARKPKLVLIETPSNPLLHVTDIELCVREAHAVGALVVADNTFMSPFLQSPIALGCDIVVHSTTKFINGHSDVIGGAVLAKDPALGQELVWWANCTGVMGAPFDSYLTLRGLRTLAVRLERQQASAAAFVTALQARAEVKRIYYPGLESHPGHAIAKRQQKGFGSMLSVDFQDDVDVAALLPKLEIFSTAESLGGFESLVCVPALLTHVSMPPEARAEAGISDTLTRFSIGLEHADDLIADLYQALDAIAPAKTLKSA